MKIIFFGTPEFAAFSLNFLIKKNYEVIAVVTSPDTKKGRGRNVLPTQVKEKALENNIPILQPIDLNDHLFIKRLKAFKADLFIVVAFKFLPKLIWSIPHKGTVNLHTSYLPNYKGAAPINRVLINGEKQTGITTFYINEHIDSGDLIIRKRIPIHCDMTAAQLYIIMKETGFTILEKTIHLININKALKIDTKPLNNLIYAKKLTKDLSKINWKLDVEQIHNLVRGLSPYTENNILLKDISIFPSAWFTLNINDNKKRIKLHLTKIGEETEKPHLYIHTDNKKNFQIAVNGRFLAILNLQLEGKKSMNIQQFLQGNKIDNNATIS